MILKTKKISECMGMSMEIYIVRIYRRDGADSFRISGIIEKPGCSTAKPFADIDELLSILRKGDVIDRGNKGLAIKS